MTAIARTAAALRGRCRAQFHRSVRERGERDARQGRVSLEHTSRERILARVRGSGSQAFPLRVEAQGEDPLFLHTTCECPDYATGMLCNHLWATLVALDEVGWRDDIADDADLVILHRKDLSDIHEEGEPGVLPGAIVSEAAQGSRRGNAAAPPWQDLMRSAAHDAHDPAPLLFGTPAGDGLEQPWFVLNPAASLNAGALVVDIHRLAGAGADGARLQRCAVSIGSLSRFSDADDRALLSLLLGNQPEMDGIDSYDRHLDDVAGQATSWRIVPVMHELLLPRLCETGRLVVQEGSDMHPRSFRPLAWDGSTPWALRVVVEAAAAGEGWQLRGELDRGAQRMSPAQLELALEDGVILTGAGLARLEDATQGRWLALFHTRCFHLPRADADSFLAGWWSLGERPPISLPPELDMERVAVTPRASVSVGAQDPGGLPSCDPLPVAAAFHYDGERIDWDTPGDTLLDARARVIIQRDTGHERALRRRLSQLGVQRAPASSLDPGALVIAARHAAGLHALAMEGWTVTVDGARLRPPGPMDLDVSTGLDWFELQLRVDYEGQVVELPALLEALERGNDWVPLGDGTRALLPAKWLHDNRGFLALGGRDGGAVRFSASQALFVDSLLSQPARVHSDPEFARWRDRLAELAVVQPADAPPSFMGRLRDYQRKGLGWLRSLAETRLGGCLADDMGLGKTVQVLALLEWWRTRAQPPAQPSLVVVPRSLVWNWLEEASRFAPRLRVLDYTGARRGRALARLHEHDLVITTYGSLRRDVALLAEQPLHYLILDEAQAIKNANSQAAMACRSLHAAHRLAITGTPVENHLGELWSLFEFLNPGLLGTAAAFEPVGRAAAGGGDAALSLARGLAPFILRRSKAQVLPELPAKTEQTLMLDLPQEQRRLYDELRDYYRHRLLEPRDAGEPEQGGIQVLEALLRLRQAACHPGLIDPRLREEPSAKLDMLGASLETLVSQGHKVLVFSQFTRLLAILRQRLDNAGVAHAYLDGQTQHRSAVVARFQDDPECGAFLISLRAGGYGLNLTAADYVFILDPWWNPAVEAQAVDRSHRLGQTRPVFAYRLIARDTVEEKILVLKGHKQALADAIVAREPGPLRGLTARDLHVLLDP